MTYPAKLLLTLVLLFVFSGCSAGKTQPNNGEEESAAADSTAGSTDSTGSAGSADAAAKDDTFADSQTPKIDRELQSFLASPGLDSRYYENFGKARTAKMKEAKTVNDAIKKKIAETKDRDIRAHLAIQRARVFLAVACQMINVKPAPDAGADEISKTTAYAKQASDLFFPGADESLRDAISFDGARSEEAGQMLLSLRAMNDRKGYCESNERLWRPQG